MQIDMFLHSVAIAVPTISVKGADFVNSNTGDRFQVVGVAYQPGGSSGFNPGSDPLSDSSACLRDAALMQMLGVNAIRVYSVDPTLDHDLCASIFNSVGIYMLIDVNSPLPGQSLDRSEAFKNYPNTLLFFSGNEIINDVPSGSINPPYIRAVTRDLKNYIAKHSARSIPVGYSAADVRGVLVDTWNYLQCTLIQGSTDASRVDTFALNSYSWCGQATYISSTYNVLTADFSTTSVPVFFSEYGCNRVYPRIFTEVEAIYGPEMSASLSGGLVYEYTQGDNNFGLVMVNNSGSAQLLIDYNNLQTQYKALNFSMVEGMPAMNTSNVPPTCSASLITTSGFATNFTIPETPSGAQELISNGISRPNNGRIVSVTNLQVSQTVLESNGAVITGLAIKPVADDESNVPSSSSSSVNPTSSSSLPHSATSAAPAATSSKAAAGIAAEPRRVGELLLGGMVVVVLCL
ncbi:MAG: hypothetical protein M1818_001879 [Claussenomyces sp. TS43310]|nr:MAG: hypothetical protein M1818_001879 [Claussenomyces sp. TS43310]